MGSTLDKLKATQELPEVKKVKTDFENINLSRDQFEAKYRREREMEKRLEAERIKIEHEFEQEEKKMAKKATRIKTEEVPSNLDSEEV